MSPRRSLFIYLVRLVQPPLQFVIDIGFRFHLDAVGDAIIPLGLGSFASDGTWF
jgi:hypothetical protein